MRRPRKTRKRHLPNLLTPNTRAREALPLETLCPPVDWTALEALLGSVDVEALLASVALSPETQAWVDELLRRGDAALAGLAALLGKPV